MCGVKEVLPKSCTLSDSLLGCVYEGTYNGSKARIRRVKMYPKGEPQTIKEACIGYHVSRSRSLTKLVDVPPNGCGVETLSTPKHRSPFGSYHRSTPTHFRFDTRRGPDGIYHEQPRRRKAESCGCPLYRVVRRANSLTSYLMSLKVSAISTRVT